MRELLALFAFDNRQNVGLAQDQQVLAVELELGAAILGEEHAVALFDFERDAVALVAHLALAGGDDGAFLGLLFGRIGDHNAALGDFLTLGGAYHDAVAYRANLACHAAVPPVSSGYVISQIARYSATSCERM